MTAGASVALVAAAVFAVADWYAVARHDQRLVYLAKPAATAALVAVAVLVDPIHADVRAWFVVALILSLAGDVFLMLPRDAFVAGLGSFLLAHVAYAVGLNLHTEGLWLLGATVLPLAVVLGARLVRSMRRGGHRALVAPVVAYVAVISVMVGSALASGNALAAIGAVLFMGSDALIGESRFVAMRTWMPVAIMVTYHLGQAGLALSLTT